MMENKLRADLLESTLNIYLERYGFRDADAPFASGILLCVE